MEQTEVRPTKFSKLASPRGVHDILPDEYQYFDLVEQVVKKRCDEAGFNRIATPIFEEQEVFTRSAGDTSDVVAKELYTFSTASQKRVYALKPESTAGVVRSYVEHGMASLPQPVELFYFEPHFRHDRPQKGRYRQFHQFGFEVIGASDAVVDAQIISLAHDINADLGIADRFSLQLNTLGCPQCREKYIDTLREFYFGKERSLCENCLLKLEKNPLRLLDCKVEDCQILATMASKIDRRICVECQDHYSKVKAYLQELKIPFIENRQLVRGLDYYTRTVFEFWDEHLGAQNATGGGGRYDTLVEKFGGVSAPAIGYAAGVERLIAHIKESGKKIFLKPRIDLFLVQLGFEARKKALPLLKKLREEGFHVKASLGKGSIKAQMSLADKLNAPLALVLGEVEVREDTIIIRDMKRGSQRTIHFAETIEEVKQARLGLSN